MNRIFMLTVYFVVLISSILVACQNTELLNESDPTMSKVQQTKPEPTSEPQNEPELGFAPLPQRTGPQTLTSGTVPHVQIGVELVKDVNDELFRLAFALPDVENRPTIVSLPGARGMWLIDEVILAHPEAIVSGREFAHIHQDGSLHVPLPLERALEATEKGWAERHPWADQREGWEGLVMLFTPQTMAELDVTFQLILDSYNFVTGRNLTLNDLENN